MLKNEEFTTIRTVLRRDPAAATPLPHDPAAASRCRITTPLPHQLRRKLQARIVRYADDFVVLCRGKTDAPLAAVRHVLERLDLTLNEAKTHIVDARQESFNFLGFAIRVSKGRKSGKYYPHI